MPNIEYLLPNIGRTVPPGDPGSGEWRGLGEGREGVGSAFLRVPDAWPDAQLPRFCPCGSPLDWVGCGGGFCLSGEARPVSRPLLICAAAPPPGRAGALFALLHWSLCRAFDFSWALCPGHIPLFNFSFFSPRTPLPASLFSLCSAPVPWILPLLFSPFPPPADLLEI